MRTFDQTLETLAVRGEHTPLTLGQWLRLFEDTHREVRGETQLQFSCPNVAAHPGGDQHPSFSFSPQKNVGHCFACGVTMRGDAVYQWLGSPKIPVNVASPAGNAKPYHPHWPGPLQPDHQAWLKEKGLSDLTIRAAKLGSGSQGLAIPWADGRGKLLWVNWRPLMQGKPKYWAEPGSPKRLSLYGWHVLPRCVTRLVLVEGELDALALIQAGVPAVAMGGLYISRDQQEQLQRRGVPLILWTDGDKAGQDALPRLRQQLAGMPLVKFNCPPHSPKDYPAEQVREWLHVG